MKDEWNNECPYDFKNIQFMRPLTDGEYDPDIGIDTWVYTFNAYDVENNIYEDAWRVINKATGDDGCNACFGNVIKPYCYDSDGSTYSQCYRLNDIVFLNTYDEKNATYFNCHSNTFDNNCRLNTFGCGCYNNIFKFGCTNNAFGHSYIYNTFEYNCNGNTFGTNCIANTIGSNFQFNTFGAECQSNTFGNNCEYKHLEYTSNKESGISGGTPEFWFNGEKKW